MALGGYPRWRDLKTDRKRLVGGSLAASCPRCFDGSFFLALSSDIVMSTETVDSSSLPVPSTWKEVSKLNMRDLRAVLQQLHVPIEGRSTKIDLQYKLCLTLKISATGGCSGSDSLTPLEKASIPLDVLPFYQRLPSFAAISTSDGKLWTKDLRKCPQSFNLAKLESYLIHSPDKAFDGDSMESYKSLRAYQLFDERHVHNIEFCPSWPDSTGEE